jgi:hypothetical protein
MVQDFGTSFWLSKLTFELPFFSVLRGDGICRAAPILKTAMFLSSGSFQALFLPLD